MFFYLCKVLFSGFLQFNGNFVDAQSNSKYRDCAPLKLFKSWWIDDITMHIPDLVDHVAEGQLIGL